MQLVAKAVGAVDRVVQFVAWAGLGLLTWSIIYEWYKPAIQHVVQIIRAGMGW